MPEPSGTSPGAVAHLSIGEVLGLLLEEFPDVTISKIRFLESQGLIEPERTASGYRKFYANDVELLRLILREQREHFLPLRVIKDRIDSGEIEPSGDVIAKHPAATSSQSMQPVAANRAGTAQSASTTSRATVQAPSHPAVRPRNAAPSPAADDLAPTPTDMPRPDVARQGSHGSRGRTGVQEPVAAPPAASTARLLPGVFVNREELCAMAKVTPAQLAQLEDYGVVPKRNANTELYGDDAVEVAAAAAGLLRAGVDARHLRAWRTSVEREAGLFEQLVTPVLRQRNPEARSQATARVDELSSLGARLRSALMRSAMRKSLDH